MPENEELFEQVQFGWVLPSKMWTITLRCQTCGAEIVTDLSTGKQDNPVAFRHS